MDRKTLEARARRDYPHRIPDADRFGWCVVCCGDRKTTDPRYGGEKLYDLPDLGTTVRECRVCAPITERT